MNFGPRKIEIRSEASPAIRISPISCRAVYALERPGDALEADPARALDEHDVARLDQLAGRAAPPRRVGRPRARRRRGRARSPRRCSPTATSERDAGIRGVRADLAVERPARRGPARACRRAPRPCGARRAGRRRAARCIDGGTHRHGVGVVAVVDDENAVRELAAPRRAARKSARCRAPSASASSGRRAHARRRSRRARW